MKQIGGGILKGAGILIGGILLGFALLLLVECIPSSAVEKQVLSAAPVFKEESRAPSEEVLARLPEWKADHPNVFPTWMYPWCNAYLDNYTDALMLLTAGYKGEGSVIEETLMARHNTVGKLFSVDSLIRMSEAEETGETLPLTTNEYARYWHGYRVFLKPLLLVFDYTGIRIISGICQALLLAALVWILVRTGRKKLILPYVLLWAMCLPPVLAMSLQYGSIYWIFMVGSIVLFSSYEKLEKGHGLSFLFLGLGMATAYFDLLTYPMAALGIPLIGVFALRKPSSLKEDLKCLIKLCIVFAIGYGGMWAGKWLLTYLLCDPAMMKSVVDSVAFRTSRGGRDGEAISLIGMYVRNLGGFVLNPAVVGSILCAAGLVIVKAKKRELKLYRPLPLALCALIPFAWYFVTENHAFIHCYFTCRALLVTAFAILVCIALSGPKESKMQKEAVAAGNESI